MNILYFHGGSGNHGCEALVRTIIEVNKLDNVLLYSYRPFEDEKWGIDKITNDIKLTRFNINELESNYEKGSVAFSIGGDNYCCGDFSTLTNLNTRFNELGVKTVLAGCSIDEHLFDNPKLIEDLKKYSLITPRESITYSNLIKAGIEAHLVPDSAFVLETANVSLEGKYIGINASNIVDYVSPMIYTNYVKLIQYILDNTSYKVLLIPHVLQDMNDDMGILNRLKAQFNDDRVELLEEHNAMEQKGYISKCEMIICARTHCSIASYSTCVPTLVLGYSTKSKGIAKDLFGTYENYVIDSHKIANEDDLIKGFIWLNENKEEIRKHLEEIMPEYKQKCYLSKELVDKL